jgi:hypothetical protein
LNNSVYSRTGIPQPSFYFAAIQITVTTAGTYIFTSSSAIDSYGLLYNGTFNASNPFHQIISQNDNGLSYPQFLLSGTLEQGIMYTLIYTTALPFVTGNFSIIASGPALAILNRMDVSSAISEYSAIEKDEISRTENRLLMILFFLAFSTNYSSELTAHSPTYCRTGYMSSMHYFEAMQVSVSTDGNYAFVGNSVRAINSYGCLYNNSFNVSKPLLHVISENDNSAANRQFLIVATLQRGKTYILVYTTIWPLTMGQFDLASFGPSFANITRLNISSVVSKYILV